MKRLDLIIDYTSHNSILTSFEKHANNLLHNYVIQISNSEFSYEFKLEIIEFYYYNKIAKHCDDSVHKSKRQLFPNKWYLHQRSVKKSNKRNGIDFTFGDSINYGGILIKKVKYRDESFTQSKFISKLLDIFLINETDDINVFLNKINNNMVLIYKPNNKQYPLLRWKRENITKGLFKNKGYAFQLEDL